MTDQEMTDQEMTDQMMTSALRIRVLLCASLAGVAGAQDATTPPADWHVVVTGWG